MTRNRIFLLLAATLLFSLCCIGCAKKPVAAMSTEAPTAEASTMPTEPQATEPPATEQPATEAPVTEAPATETPDAEIPVRMQNGGRLSFLPEEPLEIPKLSEMVYTRPDVEKLIADIEALTEKVPGCGDAEALLNDYYPIAVQFSNLRTMDALAYYHYSKDMSDSYFSDEYIIARSNGRSKKKKKTRSMPPSPYLLAGMSLKRRISAKVFSWTMTISTPQTRATST